MPLVGGHYPVPLTDTAPSTVASATTVGNVPVVVAT
jgi:hypothetical protein